MYRLGYIKDSKKSEEPRSSNQLIVHILPEAGIKKGIGSGKEADYVVFLYQSAPHMSSSSMECNHPRSISNCNFGASGYIHFYNIVSLVHGTVQPWSITFLVTESVLDNWLVVKLAKHDCGAPIGCLESTVCQS